MKIDFYWIDLMMEKYPKTWILKDYCEEEGLNYASVRAGLSRYRKGFRARNVNKNNNVNKDPKIPSASKKIPSYSEFIELCRNHPEIPFTEQMIRNCETSKRKHWRSIVTTTIDLIKTFQSI